MIMMRELNLPDRQRFKILVVDDSSMDRDVLIRALKNHGIDNEIFQAGNGEEAMEILSKNYETIGLICLDWQMPKIDGMEFMRGVVKIPQTASIPIVMVTASSSDEAKNCAKRVNPRLGGYVVKPFGPERLMGVVLPYLS